MKKALLVISCLMLAACASGNYYGDAGKVYTGDKWWVHTKDAAGVWHPVQVATRHCNQGLPTPLDCPPPPNCDPDSPQYDFGQCVQDNMRQH
jgi:hypothetical protein